MAAKDTGTIKTIVFYPYKLLWSPAHLVEKITLMTLERKYAQHMIKLISSIYNKPIQTNKKKILKTAKNGQRV